MSKEEILNLKLKRGIDVTLTPVKYNSNIYVATFSATDLNPSNPMEECEKSDIDAELAKLHVYSDTIRSPDDFKKIPEKARVQEMLLTDPLLDGNKYDHLRSTAHSLRENGMAIIQDG